MSNSSNESLVTRLELIAAKAKQLARDIANHKLWPGELSSGLAEISEQLQRCQHEKHDPPL